MEKRSKKTQILHTTLSVLVVLFTFVLVFFIKCINNAEVTGYFMYNESRENYIQQIIRNVDSYDDMNNDSYIYRYDGEYYRIEISYRDDIVKQDETVLVPYEVEDEDGTTHTEYKEETQTKDVVVKTPIYTPYIMPTKTFVELPKDVYLDTLIIIQIEFFSVTNFEKTVNDISFWALSVAITLCLSVAYSAVYYNQRASRIESDAVQNKIVNYNDKVKIKPINFDEYARLNNLDEKKKVYKKMMTEKLAKAKGKLMLIPNEEMGKKKALKLKARIDSIERQMTDDYINDNILGINIKYEEIHPENYRYNSYDKTLSSRKDYSDEARKFSITMTRKVITSFICSALFAGLVMTCYFTFSLDGEFWLIMLATGWSVACQIFYGYRFANQIVRNEIEVPLENKTVILQDSIKWAMTHNPNEKSYDEILDEYLKSKIDAVKVETKAEYDEKLNKIQEKFDGLKQTIKEQSK